MKIKVLAVVLFVGWVPAFGLTQELGKNLPKDEVWEPLLAEGGIQFATAALSREDRPPVVVSFVFNGNSRQFFLVNGDGESWKKSANARVTLRLSDAVIRNFIDYAAAFNNLLEFEIDGKMSEITQGQLNNIFAERKRELFDEASASQRARMIHSSGDPYRFEFGGYESSYQRAGSKLEAVTDEIRKVDYLTGDEAFVYPEMVKALNEHVNLFEVVNGNLNMPMGNGMRVVHLALYAEPDGEKERAWFVGVTEDGVAFVMQQFEHFRLTDEGRQLILEADL